MRNVVPVSPSAAFEQEVASRFRRDFPSGRIVHDFYVGEEQVDVLAVLPQGIFAIECKAYTGQIVGDANGPWEARTPTRVSRIAPHDQKPYHQALRKAFAVGDLLTSVLHANPLSPSETVHGSMPVSFFHRALICRPYKDSRSIRELYCCMV
jgi:hypothetical protein